MQSHTMEGKLDIPTKYIILFWIIALILFTFYCLFRLWYLGTSARDSFYDTATPTPTSTTLSASGTSTTTAPNAIQYANDILAHDQITDVPACANVFDDNYGVRALGYRSCNDAFADYLAKGLDTSKKYGATKSVADYCPATTKSPLYMQCMATLLDKYNTSANMLQGAANDMSALVNKRLQDRSNVLNDIQLAVAPYTNSKTLQDFETQSGLLGTSNQTSDDRLSSASNYFQGKYGSSVSVFANVPQNNANKDPAIVEGFTSVSIMVEPYIVSNFFGSYTPVKGQYLAFDNLQVSLDFMAAETSTTPSSTNTAASMGPGPSNVGAVSLVITDSNTNGAIIYDVGKVDYYEGAKNAIVLDITKQTVNVVNAGDDQNLQQLLILLGVAVPTKLVIMLEQTVSGAGVARWTYKLMNLNMDTVMVMKKN